MKLAAFLMVAWTAAAAVGQDKAPEKPFRPPAVPLVTHDPYFSVWSFNDRLTDDWPKHWTGKTMGMCGMARIDGKTYRWCGPEPHDVLAMEQKKCEVGPTRTAYEFEADGVQLRVEFESPVLPADIDLASRPVMMLSAIPVARGGQKVSLYLDCSAEWAVDHPSQQVIWSRLDAANGGLVMQSFPAQEQRVLSRSGDDLRIDWGRFLLGQAATFGPEHCRVIAGHDEARRTFAKDGSLPAADDLRRSEERRVGEEGRTRGAAEPLK